MKGFLLLLIMGLFTMSHAGQMYKYKDADGNLVFSDKPPVEEQKFEKLKYASTPKKTSRIKLYYIDNNSVENVDLADMKEAKDSTIDHNKAYTLYVSNTFYSPVEIVIQVSENKKLIRKVIPARSEIALLSSDKKTEKYKYNWALGDPNAQADNFPYHAPFISAKGYKISQGFNGRFSHNSEYSKYAVDIAMDVGTYLTAVRAGTVVWVKDDYHMSGTTRYFLDKANVIRVLHDDGTFASYAHVLMDTALVKEGDIVKQGQQLARSGSSGFSTGPHLHFSIIRNVGLKSISIPFKFIDNKGKRFTPKRAMVMTGSVIDN